MAENALFGILGRMILNVQARFLLVNSKELTAAIRIDRILSFTFNDRESVLTVRYIDDPLPERFEGPLAEAILRDFRGAAQH